MISLAFAISLIGFLFFKFKDTRTGKGGKATTDQNNQDKHAIDEKNVDPNTTEQDDEKKQAKLTKQLQYRSKTKGRQSRLQCYLLS